MSHGRLCIFLCILAISLTAVPFALTVSVSSELAEDDGESPVRSQREVARLAEVVNGPLTDTMRFMVQHVPGDATDSYFSLEPQSGILQTSNRTLDRDRMCQDAGLCCHGQLVCELQLRVKLIDSANFDNSQSVRVTIRLRDLNDNAPTFPAQHQRFHLLSIDENTPIGENLRLPQATDPDSEQFSVRSYDIFDPTGHFQVNQVDLNGRLEPRLSVLKEIDRERTPGFNLSLIAKDGGTPARTGELLVRIRVNDKNDETPRFSREQLTVQLRENHTIGRPFIVLNASDADEGLNAVIRYSLRDTSAGGGPPQFSVHPHTGAVSLLRPLDYERSSSHVVVVEAADRDGQRRSQPSSRTGSATLTVSVVDVNDEPPVIALVSPKRAANDFSVDENAKGDSLVAWATVTDGDRQPQMHPYGAGRTVPVDCHLEGPGSDKFRLVMKHSEEREYEVRTVQPLDAEETPLLLLGINCTDRGDPPLSAVKHLQVRVNNLNDNRPTFDQRALTLTVPENRGGSFPVHAFNATDRDGDRVVYTLEDTPDRFYFQMNSSGQLYAVNSFDREQASQYHLKVAARDTGNPPLASEPLDVTVIVSDVNDNPPTFRRPSFEFRIAEELDPGQVVGVVQADDPDSERNGQIRYSIAEYEARRMFGMHPTEGKITTERKLDREAKSRHTFTVNAVDGGNPRLTATAQVTVQVTDANDNRPRFIYPGASNATVDTSYQNSIQTVIAEVQARDPDDGVNAETFFSLTGGSGLSLFSMDAHSGRLSLAKPLNKKDIGVYSLEVQVRDGGSPPLSSTATLLVAVKDLPADPPPPQPDSGASVRGGGGGGSSGGGSQLQLPTSPRLQGANGLRQRNLVLIICLVTLASLLAFVFLAIVAWLRRRPARLNGSGIGGGGGGGGGDERRRGSTSGQVVGVKMAAVDAGSGGSVEIQPFKQHYPSLPMPDARREAARMQTLKICTAPGIGAGNPADANTYYRIPASDESYEKSYLLSAMRQQHATGQHPTLHRVDAITPEGVAYHGYQLLQAPGSPPTSAGNSSALAESLQIDRSAAAGRDSATAHRRVLPGGVGGQQKSFNLVSSSFV